eukprot:439254-Prymnesium_polylepis.1
MLRHNNSYELSRKRPDLFSPRRPEPAVAHAALPPSSSPCAAPARQVILTISNYQDPSVLYRWLRSLRESGARCDCVVFTDDTHHAAASAVAK